jgi:hypothetical protein
LQNSITSTDQIAVLSFDSQTLKQIEQVVVPLPGGLNSIGGPTQLVRMANANTLALVTESGYIVALSGPMLAPERFSGKAEPVTRPGLWPCLSRKRSRALPPSRAPLQAHDVGPHGVTLIPTLPRKMNAIWSST